MVPEKNMNMESIKNRDLDLQLTKTHSSTMPKWCNNVGMNLCIEGVISEPTVWDVLIRFGEVFWKVAHCAVE